MPFSVHQTALREEGAEASAQSPTVEAAPPHILVVEDDHTARDMLCDALEGDGFRVSAAMSADAAIRIVETGGVTAIVTDILLAGSHRDGVWLLEQVRARRIPVIATTGQADRVDEFARLGFADVLIKPFDVERLASSLRALPPEHLTESRR